MYGEKELMSCFEKSLSDVRLKPDITFTHPVIVEDSVACWFHLNSTTQWCNELFPFTQVTIKVTHNVNLETTLETSAVAAEKVEFIECLERAKECFVLTHVTTDGNVSIRVCMERQQDVIHGLDVWHVCKNFAKNLVAKCKTVVSMLITMFV